MKSVSPVVAAFFSLHSSSMYCSIRKNNTQIVSLLFPISCYTVPLTGIAKVGNLVLEPIWKKIRTTYLDWKHKKSLDYLLQNSKHGKPLEYILRPVTRGHMNNRLSIDVRNSWKTSWPQVSTFLRAVRIGHHSGRPAFRHNAPCQLFCKYFLNYL